MKDEKIKARVVDTIAIPIENIKAAREVALEIFALNAKMKARKRVTKQELIDAAWRLANLVDSIEAKSY